MSLNCEEMCLKYCVGHCHAASSDHFENLSHNPDHSMENLLDGSYDADKYAVARKILEYCITSVLFADKKYSILKFKNSVKKYYAQALHGTATSDDEWQKCADWYEQALKVFPKDAALYDGCAVVYSKHLNKKKKAQEYFCKALKLEPENATFNRNYAVYLYGNKELSELMKYWIHADMDSANCCVDSLVAYGKT